MWGRVSSTSGALLVKSSANPALHPHACCNHLIFLSFFSLCVSVFGPSCLWICSLTQTWVKRLNSSVNTTARLLHLSLPSSTIRLFSPSFCPSGCLIGALVFASGQAGGYLADNHNSHPLAAYKSSQTFLLELRWIWQIKHLSFMLQNHFRMSKRGYH